MSESAEAARLRAKLVERLKRAGHLKSSAVEKAFLAVPRHRFVPPDVPVEEAYLDEVVPLLPRLATLSQPSIVALMLEELAVELGMKVLEIGTASGYNAALLSRLAGDQELVYTVEIDERLAEQARANLEAAGFGGVHVRAGDGTLGWPEAAPFARVIVTAEATDLSRALLSQLTAEGVLLAPFAVPGLPALLLRLRPQGSGATGEFVGVPVAFVPLRGAYAGESERETQAGRVRVAAAAAEEEAWAGGATLTLDRRLALYLVTAAVVEAAEGVPEEAAQAGWRRWEAAGCPRLAEIQVMVCPVEECPPEALAFRRRDYGFLLELPGERNPGERSESPSREVVR